MKQENKYLLLRDLYTRLPYKVIIKSVGENKVIGLWDLRDIDNLPLPYLRPMSSMTEEEKEELSHLLPKNWNVEIDKLNNFYFDMSPSIFMEINVFLNIIDWLNANHFDYRGLIELGLALKAPEGMYN